MTRVVAGAVVAAAFAGGVALRVARLDVRPMHHDEANQAVKFGALLERGEYRYDAHDHHGPTLYYLTLPAAWLRGQHTLASLDERTLRAVPVAFGMATILLLPLLAPAIGRTAVAAAAVLMAVSPAMVFYSRMFIQESMFALFTLAFVVAVGRLIVEPASASDPVEGTDPAREREPGRIVPAVMAGVAAGLCVATKETSAIVLPAALLACAIARWSVRTDLRSRPSSGRRTMRLALVGMVTAVLVAALFFSSFLAYPAGVLAPFGGAGIYIDRGITPATHGHPWYFYFGLLAWSVSGGLRWTEGAVLLLALAGAIAAWRAQPARDVVRSFWIRYVCAFAVLTGAVFSAIPYKTPWNLLPFYAATILLAGTGVATLSHAAPSRVMRAGVGLLFVAASSHLAWQAWRASIVYAADPRNPYVYAQTVPDAVRMAARIRALAALHPDGDRMQVSVIAPPYEQWPLPWYLRAMPYVGYWTAPDGAVALQAPVIVSSVDHSAAVDEALGDRYVSEFFGLRPEVVLAVYIERGLWDRFLEKVAGNERTGLKPCSTRTTDVAQDFSPARRSCHEHCGPAPAVALWRARLP